MSWKYLQTATLALLLTSCSATKETPTNNPSTLDKEHVTYAHKQDTHFYFLHPTKETPVQEAVTIARRDTSDVYHVSFPGSDAFSIHTRANSLDELLSTPTYLQERFEKATRTTNTMIIDARGVSDAATYKKQQGNLVFYFFDRNNNQRLTPFIDDAQIIYLSEQEDNKSIYLPGLHPTTTSSTSTNPQEGPRRFYHLTHQEH